ncbi:hypothetical protein BT93_L0087 [Corymbia citriodora subsp. variegata]|uniref:Uncharacterized protein n=1 Tax=Corymbia citriodora subsp. variegata TaxID=360336 RepID=A0A8T0CQQ8_CORYI|nr:hypothetical protein BT93_L0087 [Corymbia citriodora subsp. variegata]
MTCVFNILSKVKKLLSSLWKKPTSSASTEVVNQHHQQQQPQDDRVPDQEPSEALQTGALNNGGKVRSKDESRSSESEWVISIKKNLEQARQDNEACSWANLSIYQIPQHLRDGREKAYVPDIVCLGPYHHNEPHLRKMDQHKWRCLQCMLARNKHNIGLYLDSVKKVEKAAHAYYEGPIDMTSEKFVEMMVLDGCFVIELFRGFTEGFTELGYPHNDPVFSMQESLHTIQRDMIMLENQIPLFILKGLLRLSKPHMKKHVANLALEFFSPLKPTGDSSLELAQLSDHGRLHCLEVFRLSLLDLGRKPESREQNWQLKTPQQLIHSVTEIREAGIRFKKSETGGLWDIKFKDGVLWIPRLLIHDGTRSLFLNLMAFEQSHIDCSNDITSYVIFMDNLINSAEDIRYLHNQCCDLQPLLLKTRLALPNPWPTPLPPSKSIKVLSDLAMEVSVSITDPRSLLADPRLVSPDPWPVSLSSSEDKW